jgi:hypothetical protein
MSNLTNDIAAACEFQADQVSDGADILRNLRKKEAKEERNWRAAIIGLSAVSVITVAVGVVAAKEPTGVADTNAASSEGIKHDSSASAPMPSDNSLRLAPGWLPQGYIEYARAENAAWQGASRQYWLGTGTTAINTVTIANYALVGEWSKARELIAANADKVSINGRVAAYVHDSDSIRARLFWVTADNRVTVVSASMKTGARDFAQHVAESLRVAPPMPTVKLCEFVQPIMKLRLSIQSISESSAGKWDGQCEYMLDGSTSSYRGVTVTLSAEQSTSKYSGEKISIHGLTAYYSEGITNSVTIVPLVNGHHVSVWANPGDATKAQLIQLATALQITPPTDLSWLGK